MLREGKRPAAPCAKRNTVNDESRAMVSPFTTGPAFGRRVDGSECEGVDMKLLSNLMPPPRVAGAAAYIVCFIGSRPTRRHRTRREACKRRPLAKPQVLGGGAHIRG